MPRCSSLVLLIAVLSASLTPVAGRGSLKQFGKIKGRVADVNDASIVRAEVLIAGEGLRWQMVTNTAGEFEMSLPTGEYQLSVEAPGFRRFASKKFQITSRKTQSFKIEMQVAPPRGLVPASPDQESDLFCWYCASFAVQDVCAQLNV